MERSQTIDDRIRRAEEIYARRNQNIRTTQARVNVSNSNNNNDYRLLKKMVLQILICLLIYFVFFLIKNSNYIFSEEVLLRAREILSYDINFQEQYSNLQGYINGLNGSSNDNEGNNEKGDIIPPQEEKENNETSDDNNEQNEQLDVIDSSINTVSDTLSVTDSQELQEDSSSITETRELTDAEKISSNYSLTKPLSRNNYI